MLSIRLLEGKSEEGTSWRTADFLVLDTDSEYLQRSGLHTGGYYTDHPRIRFSEVRVVRQYDARRTFKVLIHELIHAFIWLFHLPRKWSAALDKRAGKGA